MRLRRVFPVFFALLIGCAPALAQNPSPPRISKMTREQIIHAFDEELVYVRTNFPMGKTGLKLKNGVITPSGEDLRRMMALWGPAAKPGDLARITEIVIKTITFISRLTAAPSGSRSGTSASRFKAPVEPKSPPLIRGPTPAGHSSTFISTNMFPK